MVVLAVGMGLFGPPNVSALFGAFSRERYGVAGAYQQLTRNLAQAIGQVAHGRPSCGGLAAWRSLPVTDDGLPGRLLLATCSWCRHGRSLLAARGPSQPPARRSGTPPGSLTSSRERSPFAIGG
jgi:hypothetical protein